VAVFTERSRRWIAEERDDVASAPPSTRPWSKDAESARGAAPAPAPAEPSVAGSAAKSTRSDSTESIARSSQPQRERLGTGHGEREWSQVGTTRFERASSQPAETVAIWYDSYRNLAARGIIPRRPLASRDPEPFPNGFVADPPRRFR
jgi:hypothetical protein